MLFSVAFASPVLAQMGQGGNMMGQMRGEQFGHMDNRFVGFENHTLSQISSMFGVPVDDIIFDMGLPEDVDPNLTIGEIEDKYSVSGDLVANYMVLHMGNMSTSVNVREFVQMRQQAMHGIRMQGMAQGLNFMMQGQSAFGNYTTFAFDESGEISNFALSGDQIFDSVKVSDFDYISQNIRGSNAAYIGSSSLINIHDNPMATMQVRALADKTIVFDLADDVEASIDNEELNGATIIKITKNNFQGFLIVSPDFLTGDSQVSGIDINIAGEIITVDLVENSLVMFRATTMSPQLHQTMFQYSTQSLSMNQMINNGIAMGRVGAEITMHNGGNSMSFLNYTPVDVQVKEARQNRVVLGVSSKLKESQVIVINMDNRTMDFTRPDRLRLRYDGVPLNYTNNIDELFNNGNMPLCYFLQENETSSMLVYMPEFSEHEIIIELDPESDENENEAVDEAETETEGETEDAVPTPGFEILFAAVALGAAYRLKRK
jgi:MAST domain-containing protein